MAYQGKCVPCKVRWDWDKELPLRKCTCPDCGEQLKQTSGQLQWPTKKARVHKTGKGEKALWNEESGRPRRFVKH